MMLHCQKPTVVLMLGTIFIHVSSTVSQVTKNCSAPPTASEPVNYNFPVVDGAGYNVCPTSDAASQFVWVFQPASNAPVANARGTYIVSGTNLTRCVYNASSSQPLELVVTPPPTNQNKSGNFDVTFVSQAGNTVNLTVSYAPTGFYREVNGSIVQGSSFTEPLWRVIGLMLGSVTVCRRRQQGGSGMLESVPFLARDVLPVDTDTCLPGVGMFRNPFYISLGISGEVPNDLIGETLPIVLVTRNCQNPDIRSDPVMITVSPSTSPVPSPSSVTISEVGLTGNDLESISIGETTSLVCEATTTARPMELNITWFRAENGSDVQLFHNGDSITITMEMLNTTTRSTLTIRVTGMEDYTQYYCLANSGNSTEMSDGTVSIEGPGSIPVVSLSVVVIVVIALSGPMLILLVAVTVVPAGCYYYHKKTKKSVHEDVAPLRSKSWNLEESFPNGSVEMKGAQSETVFMKGAQSDTVSVLRSLLPQQMLIPNEQIQVLRVVGQGEFGVVYKAVLRRADGASEMVAVKTLKGIFIRAGDVQNLVEEVLKMQHFHHPNVMSLVGVSLECSAGGPCVIMPFMAKGSLLHYLRQETETLKPSKETDNTQVGAVQKLLLKMCLQIAKGMEYLASVKFVHRDLAARNCMIDMNNNVKVADFGLTEDIYTKSYYRQDTSDTSIRLPLKWMALESIKLRVFSEKTDMWSFGVTCWEVFSAGEIPYPSLHPRQVLNMLEEGERMERPRNAACSDDIYTLMLECWNADPQTRPSFADMVVRLDSLLESVAEYLDISIMVTNNRDSDTAAEKSEPINSDLLNNQL